MKSDNRRKILIGMAIAGATQLPNTWQKPIVDAVILPSHAKTSDDTDSGAPGNPVITEFSGNLPYTPNSLNVQNASKTEILSLLIPPAYAGGILVNGQADICITVENAQTYTAKIQLLAGRNMASFEAAGDVGGQPVIITPFENIACNGPSELYLEVISTSNEGTIFEITTRNGTIVSHGLLKAGTCTLTLGPCEPALTK